jgi:alpha-L-rhamnosidase
MHPNKMGENDARARRFLLPTRVVWQSGPPNTVLGAENLLKAGAPPCHLRSEDGPASLVLDFGREIHGGIELRNGITKDHAPVKVRVRFGESVAEAMGAPNQDHAIHDSEVLVPWYGSTEIGNTGFRFVRIDLVDPGDHLELVHLRAVLLFHDDPYLGTFRCNDARLNTIWDVGAYSVHLCMQEHLWDGIKRDRLVWIGDMHPETMVINTVFGAHPVVPQSLDFVRDQTPLPGWMNGISSYSLWWVRIHHCWYHYHGDRAYLAAQKDYLLGLLDQLFGEVEKNGKEALGGGRFLDWPTSEDENAIHIGLQALLTLAFDEAAGLCDVLGETQTAGRCRDVARRMRDYTPPETKVKQSAALIALAGYGTPEAVNKAVLADNPLKGISTFYGYYVLQARAAAGDYAGALEVIRKYWGAMLDMGATTFWEDFNLDWVPGSAPIDELVPEGMKSIHADYGDYCYKGLRHSLCHGWAAGPTAWMSEHVLGVQPLAPGCTEVAIAPNLAGLDFAEGAFPTPRGVIRVAHRKDASGKVSTEVEAPEGVRIVERPGS